MNKILVGSQYFFSLYPDFKSKDIDELEIIETTEFSVIRQLTGKSKCLFQLKKKACTNDYIEDALRSNCGMVLGRFLIPEFCKQIDFTIDDLPRLSPLIDKLDSAHKYEQNIYDSYIKNNGFYLTSEQRAEAYKIYKNARKEKVNV